MNFFNICSNLFYSQKKDIYIFLKRYFSSAELKKSELNIHSIKHTINEHINILEQYKYLSIRFNDPNTLKTNIFRRNRKHEIDHLHERFKHLQNLFEKKNDLEYLKFENAKLISDIKTKGNTLMNLQIDQIKDKGRKIKEELKLLLNGPNGYREIENSLLPELISLPVDIDPKTPDKYVTILEEVKQNSNAINNIISHIDLCGDNLNICPHEISKIKQLDLQMHYLENNLSKMEIQFVRWLQSFIESNSNNIHIICSDMVKKYIADSCEDNNEKLLCLDTEMGDPNHDLVLTGNSLSTFIAYLTSLDDNIYSTNKFYRIGSSYKHESLNNFGLYQVSQNLQLDVFSTSTNEQNSEILFNENLNLLKLFYHSLNLPHKLIYVPAYDLLNFESIKVEAYLWSPAFKQYFKSGYVRSFKDIFSRRFELKCKNNYLFMNHGVLIKVPTFLASLIENNQNAALSSLSSVLPQSDGLKF